MIMGIVSITSAPSLHSAAESYVKDVELGFFESESYRESLSVLLQMFTSYLLHWRDNESELPETFQEVLLLLSLPSGESVVCSGFLDALGWHHRYSHLDDAKIIGWRPIYLL